MKKTIKKRAFISAIAMLIVSAIVLTSSTFAWFSMAKRVEVEAMNLSITSPEGIQLSANATAWTTKLTRNEIEGKEEGAYARFNAYSNHKNNIPTVLTPVSSPFVLTGSTKLPVWYGGSINDANVLTTTLISSDTAAEAGYVAFDVFVKLDKAQKVGFGSSTVECEGNPDACYAIKMAVVNCGQVTDTTATAVAAVKPAGTETNVAGLGNRRNAVVYDFGYSTQHTLASGIENGEYDGRPPIGKAGTCNAKPASDTSLAPMLADPNVGITGTFFGLEATDSDSAFFNAYAGITKLRIYFYVDGQDCDCANDVAGQDVTFNLVFTI